MTIKAWLKKFNNSPDQLYHIAADALKCEELKNSAQAYLSARAAFWDKLVEIGYTRN